MGNPSEDHVGLELVTQSSLWVSSPEPVPVAEGGGASASAAGEQRRTFARSACGHNFKWYEGIEGGKSSFQYACGNAFDPTDKGESVVWRGTQRGALIYAPGKVVRHNNARACTQDTPSKSSISKYAIEPAYQCQFGPKTSDQNGGASADPGIISQGASALDARAQRLVRGGTLFARS
jgi:hypothetical protein